MDKDTIPCFLCGQNPLKFRIVSPGEYADEEVSFKYVGEGSVKMPKGSKIFFIRAVERKVADADGEGTNLALDLMENNPFVFASGSFRGYRLPYFGCHCGDYVYICESCIQAQERKLHSEIIKKLHREIGEQLEEFLFHDLFLRGMLTCASTEILSRISFDDSRKVLQELHKISDNLRQANPLKDGIFYQALQKLEEIESGLKNNLREAVVAV